MNRKIMLTGTIALLLLSIGNSHGQSTEVILFPDMPQNAGISCQDVPLPVTKCSNMIYNCAFSANAGNPGNNAFAPGWDIAFGSPGLQSGSIGSGVPATARYALMNEKEGIAQKITPVEKGKQYVMSFFEQNQFGISGVPTVYPLAFRMVLLKCQDYTDMIHDIGNGYPVIPPGSQTIYCSTHETSPSPWRQYWVHFTANDDYNVILIYPQQDPSVPPSNINIQFAYPELYELPQVVPVLPINPGCTVDLPATCAAPINALFTWDGPAGQEIVLSPGEIFTINASSSLNAGTWTLNISPSTGVYANGTNSCSYGGSLPGFTVTVPECDGGTWPKVYETKPCESIFKTDNGNIVIQFSPLPSVPYMNHDGPYASYGVASTLQYNLSGQTSWYSNVDATFPLHNGTLQMNDLSYHAAATNAIVAGPAMVPANERIIAETSDGGYITTDIMTPIWNDTWYVRNIYIHTAAGTSAPVPVKGYARTVFNPHSNKLFLMISNNLFVYSITGSTCSLLTQTFFEGYYAQVADDDRVYVIHNNQLAELNYSGSTGTYTPVSVAGFNNSYIGSDYNSGMVSNNPYTENRLVVTNTSDNFLYAIDLALMTSKKIPVSYPPFYRAHYAYNGDDVYVGIETFAPYNIGTQHIPLIGNPDPLFSFTRLNLQTDFAARSSVAFETISKPLSVAQQAAPAAVVVPNPANNYIKIAIANQDAAAIYTIVIRDVTSVVKLEKKGYTSGAAIDVSLLGKGFHTVEITDANGKKINTRFIKL